MKIDENDDDSDLEGRYEDVNSSVWDSILWILLILVLLFLFTQLISENILNRYQHPSVRIKEAASGHRWVYSDLVIDFPLHCSICQSLLLTSKGQYCSNCGMSSCVEPKCIKKANTEHQCKEIFREEVDQDKRFCHHWVKGNLPFNSECEVCEEVCGDGPGIVDIRCCWCQRTVHTKCQPLLCNICDFGEYNRFIVPPTAVIPKSDRSVRHPTRKVISHVLSQTPEQPWNPLIVIGNRKSGNNDGAAVLSGLRTYLNPAQVTDLAEANIQDGIEWCRLVGKDVKCYLLVAGGDGTISWALNTVDEMKIENLPPLAIFPLGTGNDLARTLGYGSGATGAESIKEYLDNLKKAKESKLDRWKISVDHFRFRRLGFQLPRQELFMQNYLSIGVDALVTHNFHKARESPFYLFSSRIINKLIYFTYGTKDIMERECKDLDKVIEVFLDGERAELPNIESVVVLNIPFWGAGVRAWDLGTGHANFPRPSINDKKLEVFCIYSSFHIGQMQIGLSEPYRVGQASEVIIRLKESAPMQIDGEPWEQHPAEIKIAHHTQVPILVNYSSSAI